MPLLSAGRGCILFLTNKISQKWWHVTPMVTLCYIRVCLADWEEILQCLSQHIKVAILLGNSTIFFKFFALLIQLRGEKMFYLPLWHYPLT